MQKYIFLLEHKICNLYDKDLITFTNFNIKN